MSIGQHFEHTLLRKYKAVFGTLFNNIIITRSDGVEKESQKFKVPLEYGPREKYLAMITAKPDKQVIAISLPRMSFELTGMSFDASRKLSRSNKIHTTDKIIHYGSPWNFNFQLNIMTKSDLDASKIVEQILFYFQPDYTVDVKLIDGIDHINRIPIVFNQVSHQDAYEGDFIQRRVLMWTLDFTLKGWLYGPVNDSKQIKFIDVSVFGNINGKGSSQKTTIQPGLTPDGKPTTDINETIPFRQIEEFDDWDFIVQNFEEWVE